jgi:copper(I)-binding protein
MSREVLRCRHRRWIAGALRDVGALRARLRRGWRATFIAALLAAGAALVAGAALAAGAGASPPDPSRTVPAAIRSPARVGDPWIRWLPGDLPAAGYATITNLGDAPLTLLGVSSRDYGSVMFHRTRLERGMETMLPLDSLAVPPRSSVSFAPGGNHLMLMQPLHAIAPGDRLILTLHFSAGPDLEVPFEVRRADGRPVGGDRATPGRVGSP